MVKEKDKKVQIKVTVETRERLKRRGLKGQSYDDVIVEVLEKVEARTYYYFACNNCKMLLRSIVDNPSGHVKCPNCGKDAFHKITKKEYDYVKGSEENDVS